MKYKTEGFKVFMTVWGKVPEYKKVKKKNIRKEIEEINHSRYDGAFAHCLEDTLYLEVLQAIAKGDVKHPKKIAQEALKSQKINFKRECT